MSRYQPSCQYVVSTSDPCKEAAVVYVPRTWCPKDLLQKDSSEEVYLPAPQQDISSQNSKILRRLTESG